MEPPSDEPMEPNARPALDAPDPQLKALVDSLVQAQVAAIENTYRRNIEEQESVIVTQRQELDALRSKFSEIQMNDSHHPETADEDTPMASGLQKPSRRKAQKKKAPQVASKASTSAAAFPVASESNVPEVVSSASPVASTKETPKSSSEVHRLTRQELPKELRTLKDAMFLHVRVLWGLTDAKDVPDSPSPDVIENFLARCSSEAQLTAFRSPNSPALVSPIPNQVNTTLSIVRSGKVTNQIRLVEENMLNYIYGYLARFGLLRWGPDLRQSAYSLYNSACRIVAIDTFKQAVISHAYAHLRPNKKYAVDNEILLKLYDHVVHQYHSKRYQKNLRNPGSVRATDEASPSYHGRKRLSEARIEFLSGNQYPQRYLDMVDPKATSDDEPDPEGRKKDGRKIYWIKKRPERSAKAERFIRLLDYKREEEAKLRPSYRASRERLRLVPKQGQKNTAFPGLASGLPLDYYDPAFFNTLQPRTRARVASQTIALLPDVEQSFTKCPDERLSDHDFIGKYGRNVFAQYTLDDLDNFDDTILEEWLEVDGDDEPDSDYSTTSNEEDEDITMEEKQTDLGHDGNQVSNRANVD